MLKCQNCQKMCEEYYCMPDNNTILCESCWKKGLALMQLHAKRLREIPLELEQLNHRLLEKISLDMHDEAKAIVSHKNRLYQEKQQIFKSGRPYMRAEFISASKAKHFETIELPAKKKAAEERMRAEQEAKRKAEQERIRAEQKAERKRVAEEQERIRIAEEKRKKIEDILKPFEDDMLQKKKVACKDRVKVAAETYREEVMLRCFRDSAVSVYIALKQNPNLTPKLKSMIQKRDTPIPVKSHPTSTPLPPSPPPTQNNDNDNDIGCFGVLVILAIIVGIIILIINL